MATLWWVMLAVATVIFVGVMALLFLAYRSPEILRRLSPRAWVIAGGLAMPIPVLVALTGVSLALGQHLQLRETDRTINVLAQRWSWEFRYDDEAMSPNVLHLPADTPVSLVVQSADVIHGFWIPRIGPKIDAVPGYRNVVVVEADRPGTYHGVCAEYCGEGHDIMGFTVIVHAQDEYDAVIAGLR